MAPERRPSSDDRARDGAGETFDSATTESEYSSGERRDRVITRRGRAGASPRRRIARCVELRSLSARDERIKREQTGVNL